MSLSLEELSFMLRGGNKLLTVSQPTDHDRDDVIYPIGIEYDEDSPSVRKWLVEPGREYEPLEAGMGRYILMNDCAYLKVSEDGWEYCGAYEERPKVCQDFEVGGVKCVKLRLLRGVDSTD